VKAADVHALGDQDLVQQLKEAREETFNLRFLARLMTVARERGIDLRRELK
jgi:ribosomal protein L29